MNFDNEEQTSESSTNDEDGLRLNKAVPKQILALSDEHVDLVSRFRKMFRLPDSLVGLVTVSKEVCLDLRALNKLGFEIAATSELVEQFHKAITVQMSLDAEFDRYQSKYLGITEIRLMTRVMSETYSTQQKQRIRAIRGLFIHAALCDGKRLNQELLKDLIEIVNGNEEFLVLFNCSPNELKTLSNVSENVEPFIKSMQKLLSTTGNSLSDVILNGAKNNIITYVQSNPTPSKASVQTGEQKKNGATDHVEDEKPSDLISYVTYTQQFNGQRENSGIIERYEYLMPFEIEIIFPNIIRDLTNEISREVAIACLLTFLLRCRPTRFPMIGLTQTAEFSAWIDVPNGFFCWDLNKITKIRAPSDLEISIVQIPLPEQVALNLQQLFSKHKNSENLSDLFSLTGVELDIASKKYIKTKAMTSHRPTLSRLEVSYGRYLALHTHDESYAAVISLDFTLGTTSNFNYTTIQGVQLSALLVKVYQKLGFIQKELPTIKNAASPNKINPIDVKNLVSKILKNISDAFAAVSKNITFDRLCDLHLEISKNILCLNVIYTGHRNAEEYGFFSHTVDSENGLCLISDKRINDYQWGRMTPLGKTQCESIELYLNWLESLKNRLFRVNKKLALGVDSVLKSSEEMPNPLFFKIDKAGIKPLGTKDIKNLFDDLQLPANCGRDYVDFLIKDHGSNSTIAMTFEGHANVGQEQISNISLIHFDKVLNEVRQIINDDFKKSYTTRVPEFNPRTLKNNNQVLIKNKNKTILNSSYIVKNSLATQCPFSESTLQNLNGIKSCIEEWKSDSESLTILDLKYSLSLCDGVASAEELKACIKALFEGSIFLIGGQFFVDTVTQTLGYRRVWLEHITVLIAVVLSESKEQIEFENDSSEKLINSLQAHYILHAPAMLGLWANGTFSSRCSRPQTLARHYFNQPEVKSYDNKSSRKIIFFDDKVISLAINRACETEQYAGTNQTRVKRLAAEIDYILNQEIDEISVLVLATFVRYLTTKKLAPTTILRYYNAVKLFVDLFAGQIESLSQLRSINWQEVIGQWSQVEKISEDNSPELSAINHFLDFVESETKIHRGSKSLSSPVLEPTDYPSAFEIQRAFELIRINDSLNETMRLEALVMLGISSQYALRPSEIRSIRLIDVFVGEPIHIVITSEALGKVKTNNANRVLPLNDDAFQTKVLLKKLHAIKSAFNKEESFLFGDADGLDLNATHETFNVIRSALETIAGFQVSIMSFRQFNATKHISNAIQQSGQDALNDRKIISVISSLSGHGHGLTTHENYACGYDMQRKKFWDSYKKKISFHAPIKQLKQRMGLDFQGNLPENKSTFELVKGIISNYPTFQKRVVDCKDFVKPFYSTLPNPSIKQNLDGIYNCCYVFNLSNGLLSEEAALNSRIVSTQKTKIDKGFQLVANSIFKEFVASNKGDFRSHLFEDAFFQIQDTFKSLAIYQPQAWMLIQMLPVNLSSQINVTNLDQLSFFQQQYELFQFAGFEIELTINSNIDIELRKKLRKMPFQLLTERPLIKNTKSIISFWPKHLSRTKRARNLALVMQKINLILLTNSIIVLGA